MTQSPPHPRQQPSTPTPRAWEEGHSWSGGREPQGREQQDGTGLGRLGPAGDQGVEGKGRSRGPRWEGQAGGRAGGLRAMEGPEVGSLPSLGGCPGAPLRPQGLFTLHSPEILSPADPGTETENLGAGLGWRPTAGVQPPVGLQRARSLHWPPGGRGRTDRRWERKVAAPIPAAQSPSHCPSHQLGGSPHPPAPPTTGCQLPDPPPTCEAPKPRRRQDQPSTPQNLKMQGTTAKTKSQARPTPDLPFSCQPDLCTLKMLKMPADFLNTSDFTKSSSWARVSSRWELAQIPKQQARPWGGTQVHSHLGKVGDGEEYTCMCTPSSASVHTTHTYTQVHTLAARLRGQRVTTASKPAGIRASRGEGAATSRSLSSWYLAVSSSSCRCFLTTSLLEAAPRVVPMHLYRKFCNEVREQGCAWLPSRGTPSTTKALPLAVPALPADAGAHDTDHRKDQRSPGRRVRSRRGCGAAAPPRRQPLRGGSQAFSPSLCQDRRGHQRQAQGASDTEPRKRN